MRTFWILLPLTLAACAAKGPVEASDAQECFDAGAVAGFEEVGQNVVRVRVPGRDGYDLTLSGPQCGDVGWAPAITIQPWTGRSSNCVGADVAIGEVLFRDSGGLTGGRLITCRIDRVRRVPADTPGEREGS